MTVRIDVDLHERAYPVVVGTGWLGQIASTVPLPPDAQRALVITQQSLVDAGHVAAVEQSLGAAGLEVTRHLVPAGEGAKSVEVLNQLWQACWDANLTRADVVVGVGGGVVGDLGGFAAATYNRGVAMLQVPTTLLAQVDAAIGGKTGINLPGGKNLVGAFHQPLAVACDVATLSSLPPRVLREGLGEVVKYGFSHDPVLLELLEQHSDDVLAGDVALLDQIVQRSAAVKAQVVAGDERESGQRAFLNLGHTYGHAVESLTGYSAVLHGEAVAIGLILALKLGVAVGRTPPDLVDRAKRVLEQVGLPTQGPTLSREEVWNVMARDKKAGPTGVRFVVLDALAKPVVVTPTRAQVDAVLDELARESSQDA